MPDRTINGNGFLTRDLRAHNAQESRERRNSRHDAGMMQG
jgi:hypothetical protein